MTAAAADAAPQAVPRKRGAGWRMGVRWRLTVWYAGVLAAILAGFAGGTYFLMRARLIAATDALLRVELDELGLEAGLARDAEDFARQLESRFSEHAHCDFQVWKGDRTAIFRSKRLTAPAAAELARFLPEDAAGDHLASVPLPGLGDFRIASRAAAGKGERYWVQAATSLAPSESELRALSFTLLLGGQLAVLAAAAGGYLLARYALAPVEAMAAAAERITAFRLSERLPAPNPEDELGRLARTLNAMIDRLQSAVEELRRFTADAAHELRTPLAVLQTEAEIALRQPRSADEYRRVVEAGLRESKRLTTLAEQLLLLCRHEGGLVPLQREEVPLHALLADVVDQVRAAAERKGLSLSCEAAPCVVLGDDVALGRLLFNLLDNAIKFTPAGGRIEVRAGVGPSAAPPATGEATERSVFVSVADDGLGIPASDLPHVFSRFYRGDRTRAGATIGTGLGLAICKSIVEAHGGSIRIDCPPGRGTAAIVTLPAVPAPADVPAGEGPLTLEQGL